MADLTSTQRTMLLVSAAGRAGRDGHGVALFHAGNWRTARSLVAQGLGRIAPGSPRSLFFANGGGLARVADPDPDIVPASWED